MRIKAGYKPWLLAASPESGRPSLEHALVERLSETEGRLVAADGFTLGVFPVELEREEEVGMIRAHLLYYASNRPWWIEGEQYYGLRLEGEWVEMTDGSRHKRLLDAELRSYPNWRTLVEGCLLEREPPAKFALDPALLRRASMALGSGRTAVITLVGDGRPVAVAPGWRWELERWEEGPLPFALVMPLRSEG